jgi:RNA polymerase sigma-32 factor
MQTYPPHTAGEGPGHLDSGPGVGRSRRIDSSAMKSYSQDLRGCSVLTPEDEHETAVRFAETGSSDLAARLVNANLRLVCRIALEYRSEHRNLLDLVQEGNLGLIHAVKKYDPHRGVKLGSYAVWWIRAYILKFILANSRLVKVGTTQAQRRLFFGLSKQRARMEKRSAVVDTKQLAAALNVTEKEVTEMEGRLSARETSLDAPVRQSDDGSDRTYMDLARADAQLRPDYQSETKEFSTLLRTQLEEFAKTLTGRDIDIYRNRLMSEEAATLSEIARRFGVSRERVRQLEEKIKERLRQHLEASLGDSFEMAEFIN